MSGKERARVVHWARNDEKEASLIALGLDSGSFASCEPKGKWELPEQCWALRNVGGGGEQADWVEMRMALVWGTLSLMHIKEEGAVTHPLCCAMDLTSVDIDSALG